MQLRLDNNFLSTKSRENFVRNFVQAYFLGGKLVYCVRKKLTFYGLIRYNLLFCKASAILTSLRNTNRVSSKINKTKLWSFELQYQDNFKIFPLTMLYNITRNTFFLLSFAIFLELVLVSGTSHRLKKFLQEFFFSQCTCLS